MEIINLYAKLPQAVQSIVVKYSSNEDKAVFITKDPSLLKYFSFDEVYDSLLNKTTNTLVNNLPAVRFVMHHTSLTFITLHHSTYLHAAMQLQYNNILNYIINIDNKPFIDKMINEIAINENVNYVDAGIIFNMQEIDLFENLLNLNQNPNQNPIVIKKLQQLNNLTKHDNWKACYDDDLVTLSRELALKKHIYYKNIIIGTLSVIGLCAVVVKKYAKYKNM